MDTFGKETEADSKFFSNPKCFSLVRKVFKHTFSDKCYADMMT